MVIWLALIILVISVSMLDSPSWFGIGLAGAGAIVGLVLLYHELLKEGGEKH